MLEKRKVASIVGRAPMCDDSGRAISYEWTLSLNDLGGLGFWHGGPAFPNTSRSFNTEQEARIYAIDLGYEVTEVRWA